MVKRAKKLIKSPLTKEQVVAQMEQNKLFQKRMKFIKESFWPTLCETADSIEDTTLFLSGFNTALMQAFLSKMSETKFSELKLDEKITGDSEKYKKILALFNDMSILEAKEYIEGMKGEIQLFLSDEQRERPLTSLKPKWVDEIGK